MYTSLNTCTAEPSVNYLDLLGSSRSRIGSLIPLPCAGAETSNFMPAGLSPFPAGYFWDLDENEKI